MYGVVKGGVWCGRQGFSVRKIQKNPNSQHVMLSAPAIENDSSEHNTTEDSLLIEYKRVAFSG